MMVKLKHTMYSQLFSEGSCLDSPSEILCNMSNAVDMARNRILPFVLRIIIHILNRCISVINQTEVGLWRNMYSEILEKETPTTKSLNFN